MSPTQLRLHRSRTPPAGFVRLLQSRSLEGNCTKNPGCRRRSATLNPGLTSLTTPWSISDTIPSRSPICIVPFCHKKASKRPPPYTAPCARAWGGKPRPDSRLEEVLPCISALHSSASTRRAAGITQRNPGRERPGLYTEAASSRPFAPPSPLLRPELYTGAASSRPFSSQPFSFPPNLLIPYPPNSLTSSSPILLTS